MAGTRGIAVLILILVSVPNVTIGNLRAQVPASTTHDHLTDVACVDVPSREKRPEFGCFNVGTATGLVFPQASVDWKPSGACSR